MKYHKLRIAWSIVSAVGCLPLLVMWVQSYYGTELATIPLSRTRTLTIFSFHGMFLTSVYADSTNRSFQWVELNLMNAADSDFLESNDPRAANIIRGLGNPQTFVFSYFWTVLILAAMAAAPWLHWHFSLRTLMIVMTLAAIGLTWAVLVW
jgi:hypothetical protein